MKEYRIRRRVVKENDVILKRQSTQIFFKNGDTDFFFNWLLGIGEIFGFSHGELYYLAQRLGNSPKPDDWKNVFLSHVNYLEQEASNSGLSEQNKGAVLSCTDLLTSLGNPIYRSIF